MVDAVLADFAACPECHVVTTRDPQLGPLQPGGIETIPASSPDEERRLFAKLAADSDATFLIAPETGGILSDRRRLIDEVAGRCLGCSAAAIDLCTSKLAVAKMLGRHGIATIGTARCRADGREQAFPFPVVVKPDDGAGSLNTRLVADERMMAELLAGFEDRSDSTNLVVQPFVSGTPFSVAAVIDSARDECVVFPPVLQKLSSDGQFRYMGGAAPYSFGALGRNAIDDLVGTVRTAIPGLSGYVGIDMIQPTVSSQDPIVVEINPRLTTSYLGYRALTDERLAERLLNRQRLPPQVRWEPRSVEFTPDGGVTLQGLS